MKSFTSKLPGMSMNPTSLQEFIQYNYDVLYERLRIVSLMLIIIYPGFLIVDVLFVKNPRYPTFSYVLTGVHLTGLVISLLFTLIYHRCQRPPKGVIINGYIFIFLTTGAVASLNSQLFTGNIYAYLIILMAVSVIFPIQPQKLALLYTIIHLGFTAGLLFMNHEGFSLLLKIVNSTGTVVISFTVSLTFYTFRKNDFLTKRTLSRTVDSFQSLFHMSPTPLILTSITDNKIQLINKQAMEYYHLDDKEAADRTADFLFKNPKERLKILAKLAEQRSIKNYTAEQFISNEVKKWSLLHFELVEYLDTPCVMVGATDITDMKKKEEKLEKYASYDMLTGVRNRRSGIETLRRQLAADNARAQEFVLCYIDINNLKKVNDRYGHSTGDDLIKTCSTIMSKHIDDKDVLFRLGGDEFVVVFFKKSMEEATRRWAAIQADFDSTNEQNDKPFQISASHGFYHYVPGTVVTLEEILEFADQEMYRNKILQKAST